MVFVMVIGCLNLYKHSVRFKWCTCHRVFGRIMDIQQNLRQSMEPLMKFPERAKQTPWNIGLIICNLSLTCFIVLLLIILLINIGPIVPDILEIIRLVKTTLYDVQVMLPQMNGTLWDLSHVLPGIKRTIYYTEAICRHTSGCLGE